LAQIDYPQILLRKLALRNYGRKIKVPEFPLFAKLFPKFLRDEIIPLWYALTAIGATDEMDDYEKIKLGIFNQLNFFQLVTGIISPFIYFICIKNFTASVLSISMLPALISATSLVLNYFKKHEAALLSYFILYPVFTCIIYINGVNLGIELCFILYGILAVFFLQDIGYMLFAIGLSMVSYFILSVIWKTYPFDLQTTNPAAYIINQLFAIGYIFYGLYLIKTENSLYQFKLLAKTRRLHNSNLEIEKQKKEIQEKAMLLEQQAAALQELNFLKDKLFSIVSHDLKAPMYAMRNFFRSANTFTATQVKKMIPDIVNDLDSTTALMENLLHWAKCQMHSSTVHPQRIHMNQLVYEVTGLLQLQITAKKISIETKNGIPVYAFADRDMANLILRNLVTNAIKFTPQGGKIVVGVHQSVNAVEVYVQDSGMGISREEMDKINQNIFYTTKGTGDEGGTGLGLMLCKEFLLKNGGRMMIESEPGNGSTFSFTLPAAN
jgi:signal transduction histidine kinase